MEYIITFFRRNRFFSYLFLVSQSFNQKLNAISFFASTSKKEFFLFDNFINQLVLFVFKTNNPFDQCSNNYRCYLFYNNT